MIPQVFCWIQVRVASRPTHSISYGIGDESIATKLPKNVKQPDSYEVDFLLYG
jgi:hypothetical protein